MRIKGFHWKGRKVKWADRENKMKKSEMARMRKGNLKEWQKKKKKQEREGKKNNQSFNFFD